MQVDAGAPAQREVRIEGFEPVHGIFDFAPDRDDAGIVWVSYSAVEDSAWVGMVRVNTHLARSDDNGVRFVEHGLLTPNINIPLDVAGLPVDGGVWNQETSRLRHDPWAAENERWVVLWHRYLALPPPIPLSAQRRFEHGWIALKTAPAPNGQWSSERKLFTASTYLRADDSIIGPAEVPLATISNALADCEVVTEPGVVTRASGWVVALQCAGPNPRVVLLQWARSTRSWSLLGSVLSRATAAFDGFDSFAAPELVEVKGTLFLVASPSVGDRYRGCRAYELSLSEPPVVSATVLSLGLGATDLGFAGACGFVEGLSGGVLQGQLFSAAPQFRTFATGSDLSR